MVQYNSFFDSIHDYVKGSTMAAWALVVSIVILLIGINGFAEDTYSSYVGVQMIEKTYNIRPASWPHTYWLVSVSFQVITILCMLAYLSNKKQYWWAFWAACGAQAIDFFSDTWYRSNGTWNGLVATIISIIFTFLFYTVGSELALTVGIGLVSRLFVEGMSQISILIRNIFAGLGQFGKILASGNSGDKGATHPTVTHAAKDVRFDSSGKGGGNPPPMGAPHGGPPVHVQTFQMAPPPPMNSDGSPKASGNGGGNKPPQGQSFQHGNNNQGKPGKMR